MECHIDIEGSFDLRSTVRILKAGRFDGGGVWWWATYTDDGPGSVAVQGVEGGVDAQAWGPGAGALLERLPRIVGADDRMQIDVPVGPVRDLLRRHGGTRLGATGAVFEAVARGILGQVVTRTEAHRSARMLMARYGEPAPGPTQGPRIFPEASVISGLSYEDLHGCGVERKRASTLIEAARRARRLDEIMDMAPDAARKRLQAVRGIGPWTTAFVMGAAYGDTDAVPIGDYHLPNTVAFALAGESRADDARMLELLEPYRPERRRVIVALKMDGVHAPRYGPKTALREHL